VAVGFESDLLSTVISGMAVGSLMCTVAAVGKYSKAFVALACVNIVVAVNAGISNLFIRQQKNPVISSGFLISGVLHGRLLLRTFCPQRNTAPIFLTLRILLCRKIFLKCLFVSD